MLKLPVKPPIVNENIDLSEYAKKSDVDAIGTSLGNKAEKKEVEKINSQLDTLTKKVDDEIKEIQSTTDTFKENINTSFNEFSNEQQNNFEALREEVLSDIEASYVGYDNEQHHNLESRLYSDFDKINQRFNINSYLEYEGISIKADNTYYGLTKEATVKGRTLQNLVSGVKSVSDKWVVEGDYFYLNIDDGTQPTVFLKLEPTLKHNTVYTVIGTMKDYEEGFLHCSFYNTDTHTPESSQGIIDSNGIFKFALAVSESGIPNSVRFFPRNTVRNVYRLSKKVLVLEGDYTNTPIAELPFVEGIQSVGENEVQEDGKYLISGKSFGKNLLNPDNCVSGFFYMGAIQPDSATQFPCALIKVKPNTEYVSNYTISELYFEGSTNGEDFIEITSTGKGIRTTAETNYIRVRTHKYLTQEGSLFKTLEEFYNNVIISEGNVVPTYEPYQESTYSYMLDEPLRQLPNGVADRINLETGVLTRKVGKVVLNGSETWLNNSAYSEGDYLASYTVITDKLPVESGGNRLNFLCDRFAVTSQKVNSSYNVLNECCFGEVGNQVLYLSIKKEKLTSPNLGGFKQWLSENPTTVYYELAEPITEQLTPTQLKSFEGTTHIMSNNTLQARTRVKIHSYVQAVVTNLINENKALRSNVDILNVENEGLKETNEVQDELIDINMMATDEVYTMIEPLLASQPMSMERGMSKLVDMYVAMVQRGLKTIDQVPIRYRAEVQAILEALEK